MIPGIVAGFPAAAAVASPQLFDIVTWTGDGTGDRQIASLDVAGGGYLEIYGDDGASSTATFTAFDGTTHTTQLINSTTRTAQYCVLNASGFIVGKDGDTTAIAATNKLGVDYVAYLFKKDPACCDIKFYNGTGSAQTIAYDVIEIGSVLFSRTETGSNVMRWWRGMGDEEYLQHGTSNAVQTSATILNSTLPTASGVTVGNNSATGTSGVGYVVVAFAHDVSAVGCIRFDLRKGDGTTSHDIPASEWRPDIIGTRGISSSSDWRGVDQERTPDFSGSESITSYGSTGVSAWASADVVSLASASGFRLVTTNSNWNTANVLYATLSARRERTAASLPTVCTWNPQDMSNQVTLSSGNLIAKKSAGTTSTWDGVRATIGRSAGKYYFEVRARWTSGTGTNGIILGIAKLNQSLRAGLGLPGGGPDGYGVYWENGDTFNNGSATACLGAGDDDEVYQVAVDLDAGKIWFGVNGTFSGDPAAGTGEQYSGLSGLYFPMVSFLQNTTYQGEGRFKTADFTHSPPSGFSAWES